MKKIFIALTLLVAGASSALAQWGRPVDYAAGPGLKDAYKDYFTIGVAVNKANVSEPAQMELIKKQFNSVTAENAWKPGEIHPAEGVWNFGLADSDADYLNRHLGGTPGLTAPEIFQGEGFPLSASSDIYSIGGIISLLFPRRFRSIVRKCRQEVPSRRYQDIKALRRAILVRRRFPMVMALVVLGVAFLALTLPVWVQNERQQDEKERKQAAIRQIQSDLNVFYRAAADSLADRSAVPNQLKAHWVRNTFVEKTVQYEQALQDPELRFVCDTVYARMVTSLSEMMLDIPQ